ncbi:MAG: hypothetical protein YK1309IOTA_2160003 [Marine Group I thaumarchaeote]|nr:MAG: hypothetical protein YK1309IOTA_2160003 [Marine Group I thaumarchaeote]
MHLKWKISYKLPIHQCPKCEKPAYNDDVDGRIRSIKLTPTYWMLF